MGNTVTVATVMNTVTVDTVTNTVTVAMVGAGVAGDMLKSVYDTDNDGKVNAAVSADSVPWSGVTGKPTIETDAATINSLIFAQTY